MFVENNHHKIEAHTTCLFESLTRSGERIDAISLVCRSPRRKIHSVGFFVLCSLELYHPVVLSFLARGHPI